MLNTATVISEMGWRFFCLDWMDANQLGRRNLTPDAFRLALGRRYNRTKKAKGTNNQHVQAKSEKDQIDTFQSTAAKLAKEHSISEATVKRAGKFADEVAAKPELQKAIATRHHRRRIP